MSHLKLPGKSNREMRKVMLNIAGYKKETEVLWYRPDGSLFLFNNWDPKYNADQSIEVLNELGVTDIPVFIRDGQIAVNLEHFIKDTIVVLTSDTLSELLFTVAVLMIGELDEAAQAG